MSSETVLSELRRAEHDRLERVLRLAEPMPIAPPGPAAASPPAPKEGDHIDLPVDDEPGEGDTVFDLPLDEPADGNADTQPLPL